MSNFLIIGGSGFIGKAFAEKVLSAYYDHVFLFARDESSLHMARMEIKALSNPDCTRDVGTYVGDIKDPISIKKAIKATCADYIIVTSALKRIEVCEENPVEAVAINVMGLENVCRMATECDTVKGVLFTSTDKAASPCGVYGSTKAIGEVIMRNYAKQFPHIKFVTTRFANVLNSTGSVIPIFKKLIEKNQNLIVRGSNNFPMTRFFLTKTQSSQVMWDALFGIEECKSGNILVPHCESFYLNHLAEIMIEESGKPIEITWVKPLPYEKLHESLLSPESLQHVSGVVDDYYILDYNILLKEDVGQALSSDSAKCRLEKEQLRSILKQEKII
jgi:FlaA1/EpsC-like NDP-sugar epimerase